MNPFLKAKHWQIFLLLFCIPIVLQFFWVGWIFSIIPAHGETPAEDPTALFESMITFFPVFMALMIVICGLNLGWFLSVAFGLRTYTPERVRLRTLPFFVGFLIPTIYILTVSLVVIRSFPSHDGLISFLHGGNIALFLFSHMIAMACIFYSLYYVAKAYKTALLKRKVERGEVIGEFFMMWFLFIGIWMLQPNINAIINGPVDPKEEEPDNTDFSRYSN